MIESLFEERPTGSGDACQDRAEKNARKAAGGAAADSLLAAALPVVRKIVGRRAAHSRFLAGEASDLVQTVLLKLLRWRDKNPAQSGEMREGDWESLGARVTFNEIRQFFRDRRRRRVEPLDELEAEHAAARVEGNSAAEISSVMLRLWKEICTLTLRQRRALLLADQEMVILLRQSGITQEELAAITELSPEKWRLIFDALPLPDEEIAALKSNRDTKKSPAASAASVRKARYEARARLWEIIK